MIPVLKGVRRRLQRPLNELRLMLVVAAMVVVVLVIVLAAMEMG